MQVAALASIHQVVQVMVALKFNRSLVEGMEVVTTCLVSAVNSQFQVLVPLQLMAMKIQSAFPKILVVVPLQVEVVVPLQVKAEVEVVDHNVRQAEECLVVVPV
jgi:hypothetical protein